MFKKTDIETITDYYDIGEKVDGQRITTGEQVKFVFGQDSKLKNIFINEDTENLFDNISNKLHRFTEILILTHTDLDGYASEYTTIATFGPANVFNIGYDVNFKENRAIAKAISKAEIIFITDLSLKDSQISDIIDLNVNNSDIIWIDHHPTSLKSEINSPLLHKYIFSKIGISAATLTYIFCTLFNEFVKTDKIENKQYILIHPFIVEIGLYDTFDAHMTKEINYACQTKLNDNQFWYIILNNLFGINNSYTNKFKGLVDNILAEMVQHGTVIKEYSDHQFAEALNKDSYEFLLVVKDSEGNIESSVRCIAINKYGFSDMFGDMYKKYAMCLRYCENAANTWIHSVYSYNEDGKGYINCTTFAEYFGGGGHIGAAGFQLDHPISLDMEDEKLGNGNKIKVLTIYKDKLNAELCR